MWNLLVWRMKLCTASVIGMFLESGSSLWRFMPSSRTFDFILSGNVLKFGRIWHILVCSAWRSSWNRKQWFKKCDTVSSLSHKHLLVSLRPRPNRWAFNWLLPTRSCVRREFPLLEPLLKCLCLLGFTWIFKFFLNCCMSVSNFKLKWEVHSIFW